MLYEPEWPNWGILFLIIKFASYVVQLSPSTNSSIRFCQPGTLSNAPGLPARWGPDRRAGTAPPCPRRTGWPRSRRRECPGWVSGEIRKAKGLGPFNLERYLTMLMSAPNRDFFPRKCKPIEVAYGKYNDRNTVPCTIRLLALIPFFKKNALLNLLQGNLKLGSIVLIFW